MDYTTQQRMVNQVEWLRKTLKVLNFQLLGEVFFSLFLFIPFLTLVSILFSLDKKATAKRRSLVNFDKLN